MKKIFLPIFMIFCLGLTSCDGLSEEEAESYVKLIDEKNEYLGRIIIIQSRLFEGNRSREDAREALEFITGEEIVEKYLQEKIGTTSDVEMMELPTNSRSMRALHDKFLSAIHYFYLSQQALEESGYVRSTGIAEGYWHESRYRYLVFGHELCRYTSVKEFYESKGQEGKAFLEFCKTPKPERFDPEKNQGQAKFMNEEETEKD